MRCLRISGLAAIAWLPLFALVTVGRRLDIQRSRVIGYRRIPRRPRSTPQRRPLGVPVAPGARPIEFQLDGHQLSRLQRRRFQCFADLLQCQHRLPQQWWLAVPPRRSATYTYTVPFQAYQFNPGQTNQVAVGEALTQQVAHTTLKDITNAITLPANWTVAGGNTNAAAGLVQQVGAVKELTNSGNVQGFTPLPGASVALSTMALKVNSPSSRRRVLQLQHQLDERSVAAPTFRAARATRSRVSRNSTAR